VRDKHFESGWKTKENIGERFEILKNQCSVGLQSFAWRKMSHWFRRNVGATESGAGERREQENKGGEGALEKQHKEKW